MRISSTLVLLLSLSFTTKAQTPCENGMADIYPCDGYDLLYHYPLGHCKVLKGLCSSIFLRNQS